MRLASLPVTIKYRSTAIAAIKYMFVQLTKYMMNALTTQPISLNGHLLFIQDKNKKRVLATNNQQSEVKANTYTCYSKSV